MKCVCPDDHPFDTVHGCIQCYLPNYYDVYAMLCLSCPTNQYYDIVDGKCEPCPKLTPYFNGTLCT